MFPLRQQAAQVLIQVLPMAAAGFGMSAQQFQAFVANYYLSVVTTLCPSLLCTRLPLILDISDG
jgi:hypothetical protein